MFPHTPNSFLAIAGVILVGIAALVQFGVPSASVVGCTGPTGPGCSNPYVGSNFGYNVTGLTVTLFDRSVVNLVGQATISGSWGDGQVFTNQPTGSVIKHTYLTGGTYQIAESVSGRNGIQQFVASSNSGITVSSTGSGGGNTTPPAGTLLAVSFSAAATNLSVRFTDTTVLTGLTVRTVSWTFGDGSTVAGAIGGTVTHVYLTAGSYTVSENVTAQPTGASTPVQSSSYARTLALSSGACISGCGGATGGPTPSVTLQPVTLLLGLSGIGLLVATIFSGPWKAVPVLIGVGLGVLTYIAAGGPI